MQAKKTKTCTAQSARLAARVRQDNVWETIFDTAFRTFLYCRTGGSRLYIVDTLLLRYCTLFLLAMFSQKYGGFAAV